MMFWKPAIILAAVSVNTVAAKIRGASLKDRASQRRELAKGGGKGGPPPEETEPSVVDDMPEPVVVPIDDGDDKSKGPPPKGVSRTEGEDFEKNGCDEYQQDKLCICHGTAGGHWNYICPAQISHHTWGESDGNGPDKEHRGLKAQLPDLCPGNDWNGHKLKVVGNKCEAGSDGVVTGDPHFSMWQGQRFDFHGGCDLVLVDNPDFNNGQGLTIHIRTKIVRWWSYVESAVVKIGDDTLEVKAGDEERAFWINGERGEKKYTHHSGPMPFTLGGFKVRYRIPREHSFQFKIFLDEDVEIILKSVREFLRVDIKEGTEDLFGTSVGLMGDYATGTMFARDGQTILEDPIEFGKEWQVLESEPKLFHNIEGPQHPETCTMPSMLEEMVDTVSRRLAGASMTREMAQEACAKASPAEFEECVDDVMATDDAELAGAYYD